VVRPIGENVPAELRTLGSEKPIAINGEHLVVNETADFTGFRNRITDLSLWCGAAVETQCVVLEDEWGG
jgi:hypothetical protein